MTDRELLRHAVATVAYRAAKALRGAPSSFAAFRADPSARTPVSVVAHMGDLFEWARSMAAGAPRWSGSPPRPWNEECDRFFAALQAFDELLASDVPLHYELPRLLQAPIADALTHIGQLAMLRRLHGVPIKGESYNQADITIGRVGFNQTPPDAKYEFD